MARARIGITDWSWGELSDEAYGRMDLVQYTKSARSLVNYRPIELGGVTRRAGTRFIAEAKFSDRDAALIPFVFSQGEAYMLEVSEGAIRFYRGRARLESSPGVPLEVVTPYAAGDVQMIKSTQSFDVLYMAHNAYPPAKLQRYGNLTWRYRMVCPLVLGSYGATPPPSYEYGTRPFGGAILTPAAVSGNGVVVNSAVGIFLPSDVGTIDNLGREIVVFNGASIGARARIITYIGPFQVTVNIESPFVDLNPIPEADWKITNSPLTGLTPSAAGPIGTHISLTLDTPGWRLNDAVKFARLNGGLVEINDFGGGFSDLVVSGTIRVELQNATKAIKGSWTLEEPSWSVLNGYPAAVVLGKGRAWWAGSPAEPITVWGSVSGDFENFAAGVLDDDSVDDALVNGQVNSILWLAMTDNLYAGTRGEIYRISAGGTGDVITPTNVDSVPALSYGARPEAAPLGISPALVFPTASGRKIREMTFDVIYARQLAPDLLLLANQLTRPIKGRLSTTQRGIKRTAYQREPISTIWGVTENGEWPLCTYLRDQNVVAWSRAQTQGDVLDVAVIPKESGIGDEVWVLVRRVINGVTKIFVEWLDDEGGIYDRLHVDCAVTVDGIGRVVLQVGAGAETPGTAVTFLAASAAFAAADVGRQIWQIGGPGQAVITVFTNPTTVTAIIQEPGFASLDDLAAGAWGVARQVVDGLGHLEGATVAVVGDGAQQADQVVTGGQITADLAIAFEVGLPYTSTLITQRPPVPDGSQGQPKGQPEILIRLHESVGGKINGRFLQYPVALTPPTTYSGDIKEPSLGISNDGLITIVQDQPLPSTVLFLQALMDVGAG